jgi:hypothetical protein
MNAYYRKCWIQQRAAAKQRRVPFQLSYEEWFGIWQHSGRLRQRGIGTGRYVMGRAGDVGGYASSNVAIVRFEENVRDGLANWKARQALTAASSDWITANSTAAVPW